jgi:AbrB family looped-hinge helix DNA binding protein
MYNTSMGASLYEAIANGESRIVQSKGEMTLPKEWRDKHEIEHGDLVAMVETDEGRLEVIPPSEAE